METTVEGALTGQIPEGTFVALSAQPDLSRRFTFVRYGVWATTFFPLLDAQDRLIVRADQWEEEPQSVDGGLEVRLEGRLVAWSDVPFSLRVGEIFLERYGLEVGEDTFALMVGDRPEDYSATRWIFVGLGLFWLLVAASLVRDLVQRRGLQG
jgi:hypothetical protein